MVAGLAAMVLGGVAADQDPGHRPVTGQPATGLGFQGPGPAGLPAHRPGVAEQAVQIDGDQTLGADPAGLGQLAALQGPAGQLDQGISAALIAAAAVIGASGGGPGGPGRPAGSGRPPAPAAR